VGRVRLLMLSVSQGVKGLLRLSTSGHELAASLARMQTTFMWTHPHPKLMFHKIVPCRIMKSKYVAWLIVPQLTLIGIASGYEIDTHALLTQEAFRQSSLFSVTEPNPKTRALALRRFLSPLVLTGDYRWQGCAETNTNSDQNGQSNFAATS
jgi:hypothetical protein